MRAFLKIFCQKYLDLNPCGYTKRINKRQDVNFLKNLGMEQSSKILKNFFLDSVKVEIIEDFTHESMQIFIQQDFLKEFSTLPKVRKKLLNIGRNSQVCRSQPTVLTPTHLKQTKNTQPLIIINAQNSPAKNYCRRHVPKTAPYDENGSNELNPPAKTPRIDPPCAYRELHIKRDVHCRMKTT